MIIIFPSRKTSNNSKIHSFVWDRIKYYFYLDQKILQILKKDYLRAYQFKLINQALTFKKKEEKNMQKDTKSMDEEKIVIKSPVQNYPGICNLCTSKQHPTIDCPFSIILYHATNLDSLKSIVQNGFNPKQGRLGKALYCSDDPTMCVRFVLKNIKKFHDPVLIKIKAMITNIKTVDSSQQVKNITRKQLQEQGIDCIKCPYFRIDGKIFYEFAIYETARQNSALYNSHACNKNYSIVSWSKIKLPQSLNRETLKRDQLNIPNPVVAQSCTTQNSVQQEKRKQEIAKNIQSLSHKKKKIQKLNKRQKKIETSKKSIIKTALA